MIALRHCEERNAVERRGNPHVRWELPIRRLVDCFGRPSLAMTMVKNMKQQKQNNDGNNGS